MSAEIEAHLAARDDWRGERLAAIRALILAAAPAIEEHIKWRKPSNPAGVISWESNGMVCTGETYKDKVKLTFAHGAKLDDPKSVFNAGFGGATRRAIDLGETDKLNAPAFKALIRAAVKFNAARAKS